MTALAELPLLHPHRAAGRATIALLAGVVAAALFPATPTLRVLIGWDAFAIVLLLEVCWLIASSDAAATQKRAGAEDPGRATVTVLALIASAFSLFAAMLLAKEHGVARTTALCGVALAWALTHTLFALRYAHLYYRDCTDVGGEGVGGLVFPGDLPPADLDFVYFSFTIGICFQVSDIAVSSPRIRRTVLLHAILAYAYSTIILALVLNFVFATLG